MTWLVSALGVIVAGVACLLAIAEYRWRARTSAALSRLLRSSAGRRPEIYSETELQNLPAPVARYFRAVLQPGQPGRAASLVLKSATA